MSAPEREAVLIVDDEADLRNLLVFKLREAGFDARAVGTGLEGLAAAKRDRPLVIVLDLMLPDLTGTEVCKRLRADPALRDIGIAMLTAKGEEMDRILGLELGADDYVVKPFSVRELVARVGAHLRSRTLATGAQASVRLGEVEFDFTRRVVRRNGEVVAALPKEIDLARFLVENKGRVVSRDELLMKVWEYPVAGIQTRTVDNYIMKLRQKVEPDPARPRYILTVRGKGYRLADA
jgi:DNA-binding response OmpR family regulator